MKIRKMIRGWYSLSCYVSCCLITICILSTSVLAQSVVLTSPATGSTQSGAISLAYVITDGAGPIQSAKVTFTSGMTSYDVSTGTALSVSAEVLPTPNGIPSGTYSVEVSYVRSAGAGGGTITSATATGVVVDATTPTPTLSSPLTGGRTSSAMALNYTLPRAPSSGQLVFNNGSSDVTTLTLGSNQSVNITVDLHNITTNTNITGISGLSNLPDGTYSVTLSAIVTVPGYFLPLPPAGAWSSLLFACETISISGR